MKAPAPVDFNAKPCRVCGSTTRYKRSGNCKPCQFRANERKNSPLPRVTAPRPLHVNIGPARDAFPFDRAARRRSDDTQGEAAVYRGAFYDLCEMCGRPDLVDGIVCERCCPMVNAPAPEAHFREPDLSDVARRLAELRR